ncbi:MAG: phosphatidate cytidylyltransferase [Bacteroidota bacterium]
MKKIEIFSVITLMLTITMSLSSCQIIGNIFKAGVWVGVLLVVGIIGLIIFLISRIGGR